jgi:hypothetical protein
MFAELPKLFGRNFAIAFFLPATVAVVLGILIFETFTPLDIVSWFGNNVIVGTTAAGLTIWLGSISMLVTNRELYRLLEGYGSLNPLRLLGFLEKKRYEDLLQQIAEARAEKAQYKKKQQPVPDSLRLRRNRLQKTLAEQFPNQSELLLPTAFGNTMRAFETYPRAMYGIEGVSGWDRLLGVIPRDYRDLIDDAKSQVDFWINLGFLGTLLYAVSVYFVFVNGRISSPLLFVIVVLISLISPLRARRAAAEWGGMVKSAFDLYLPALRDKIEMNHFQSRNEERDEWISFSQAIVYHLPKHLPQQRVEKNQPRSAKEPTN